MRVPLSWLRDYTPLDLSVEELTDTFNELGLVVDGVHVVGSEYDGVIVGHVLNVRQHPNADRVRLADVALGDGSPVQIACGAANLASGQKVPVATLGTTLPGGMKIERRKLRGEWSNGMICSRDELGLATERAPGILVLDEQLPVGLPFAEALGIERDVVFDLDIETNRPDAMCMTGIARDVAAKLGLPFSLPAPYVEENGPRIDELASLDIRDQRLCPRFTLRVLQDVKVGPSPEFLQRRLTLAGMRPINNVVDASNYVMLELGMPSHPYDRSRVARSQLGVRAARSDEMIETLDGVARTVPDGACAIIDGDDKIIGLAGVMGGKSSDINTHTTEVLLEIASFEPYSINATSRQLALRTDASARFERRVDRDGHLRAQNRFVEVLRLSDPDFRCAEGTLDVEAIPSWPAEHEQLRLRESQVKRLLGIDISRDEIRALLEPIGFLTNAIDDDVLLVTVPSFRPDCEREIDIIEEIARMYGYENIPRRMPTAPQAARLHPYQRSRRQLRASLVGMGFAEAWTMPLVSESDFARCEIRTKPIEITNAMSAEESRLRTSLLPGMLRAIAYNIARQNRELSFFEIGHVFLRPTPPSERLGNELSPYLFTEIGEVDVRGEHAGSQPCDEYERLAVCRTGTDIDGATASHMWRRLVDSMRVEGFELVEAEYEGMHPRRCCTIQSTKDGNVIGYLGEVDQTVCSTYGIDQRVAWIEVDARYFCEKVKTNPQMTPITKYPSAEFDLAFAVPSEIRASDIEGTLRDALRDVLEELTLFDVYRDERMGDGVRSLAYRARVASLDETLSEAATAQLRQRAIDLVGERYGVKLRD